ncbi:hypothetical protein JIN84_13020 [Luteolibacter yonseiensis]|uniref:Uncharacterized protein n=1 Tax=Luteolibacter yonseiensis TaxID=1144680 RepID=A0A934R5D3_9BACT|nr:hypothetical protein [Luteolibacter yonseiensis]MBK1816541.1 hypothetical protein [Luteolibacter yonseiensis]
MSDPVTVEISQALDAYQLACRGTSETPPFVGTRDEWLASLKAESPFATDGTGLTDPENWRELLDLAAMNGITSVTITAGDELELVKDGVTLWTPLYRRA